MKRGSDETLCVILTEQQWICVSTRLSHLFVVGLCLFVVGLHRSASFLSFHADILAQPFLVCSPIDPFSNPCMILTPFGSCRGPPGALILVSRLAEPPTVPTFMRMHEWVLLRHVWCDGVKAQHHCALKLVFNLNTQVDLLEWGRWKVAGSRFQKHSCYIHCQSETRQTQFRSASSCAVRFTVAQSDQSVQTATTSACSRQNQNRKLTVFMSFKCKSEASLFCLLLWRLRKFWFLQVKYFTLQSWTKHHSNSFKFSSVKKLKVAFKRLNECKTR